MATGQQVASLYAKLGADTSDLKRGLRDAEAAMGNTAGRFGQSANLISAAFRSPALVIAGLGVAAIAATADMTRGAMNLSRTMAEVKAITQGTVAEMDKLRSAAKDIGPKFGMDPNQVASGMVDLAKAGLSAEQIAGGGAKAIATLASAGGVSMAEAAEIGATAMAVWGMSAKDMARIADTVAGAANASVISVNDFRLSLAMAGAVSAMANQSFESTATAIAILGKNGIKNSDAGTSLKQMMLNLVPSSDKAAAAFEKLGIITADGSNQFFDAQQNVKSYAEIAQVLQNALVGLTQQEKLKNLEVMFGSDAIRSATIMAKEGTVGFDQMSAAIGKVSAADVAAQKLDSAGGAMDKAGAQARALGDLLGSALEPSIKGTAEGAIILMEAILKLSEEAKANQAALDSLVKSGYSLTDAQAILAAGTVGVTGSLNMASAKASDLADSYNWASSAAWSLVDAQAAVSRGMAQALDDKAAADAVALTAAKAEYTRELSLSVDARDVASGREAITAAQESFDEKKKRAEEQADSDAKSAASAARSTASAAKSAASQIASEAKSAASAAASAAAQEISDAKAAWNEKVEAARDGVSRIKQLLADLANRRVAGSQGFDDREFSLGQQIAAQELKISGMKRKGIKGSALRTEEKRLDTLTAQRGDLGNQRTLALGAGERAVALATNPPGPEMSAGDLVDLITRTQGAVQTAESAVQIADQQNNITITVGGTDSTAEEIAAAVVEAIGGSVASFEMPAKMTLAGARR